MPSIKRTSTPHQKSGPLSLHPKSQEYLRETLSKSILRPYQQEQTIDLLTWTAKYRRFNDQPPQILPALREVYRDNHPDIVILKATQVFISEWLINCCLWVTETGYAGRGNGLYVMPNQVHMDDFSQGRIGEAIQQSPYLSKRVTSNRTRLRKIAGRALYLRGSETVIQTRSIDADIVVNDEVDLFQEGAVEKSKERLGSSVSPLYRAASQPTYPEVGIDVMYEESDKRKWFIPCGRCGYDQTLTWDDNIEFTTDLQNVRIVCMKCKKPLDISAEGHWVAGYPGRDVHGYHVNKLLSPRANLKQMLARFSAVEDVQKLQSFYNADLGIPYRPRGAKPSITDFVRENYIWKEPAGRDSYMGVDVGTRLHISIIGREDSLTPYRLIEQVYVSEFDELDAIFRRYDPKLTVIDARGDPRKTLEWAQRYPYKVYRWQHHPSKTEPAWNDDTQEVMFDRTAMLDLMYAWLRAQPPRCILHSHISPDFTAQLTALVRELVRKGGDEGRLVPRYTSARPDHYAFALAFAIMAAAEFGSRSTAQVQTVHKDELVRTSVGRILPRWTGSEIARRSWR